MQTWQHSTYGGPDDLRCVDTPRPSPGPNELLVRVRASSVNPVDWKLASGMFRPLVRTRFPFVPGFDVAGEVVERGPGAEGFAVGEGVYARLDTPNGGASAEFCRMSLAVAARVPEQLSYEEAAAIPLAAMTALQGLRDDAGMTLQGYSGRVLVVGASGGVGTYAVQIARRAGAEVVGVCSGRNADLVRSLGAQEIIDYQQEATPARLAPYDIVLDCVGSEPFQRYKPHMKRGGTFVTAFPVQRGTQIGLLTSLILPGPRCKAVALKTNAADLEILSQMVREGALRSVIDHVYPFEQLPEAHRASMAGRARGKIVVLGPALDARHESAIPPR